MITETIMPYTPRIPAITTGIRLFMIIAGFHMPIDEIPFPAFAVP
jgi:hypothetical protein